MRLFAPILAALLSALAGCAQLPSASESAADAADPAARNPHERAEAVARSEPLPNVELTPQILYQILLGEVAGQRGNLALSASAYLDLARSTRDPRIARRAAEIAHFARQGESALEATRLWVEIDPESSQARQMLIGLLVGLGRAGEIEPHLTKLMSLDADNLPEGLMRLNRLFARFPDKAAAQSIIDRVTQPHVALPEARFVRAQAAAAAGSHARALEDVEAALRARPDWDQAVLLKAQIEQQQNPEAMLRTLKDYLAKHPKARDVRLQYARALAMEKRPKESRLEFERLVQDFPGNPDVVFAVGVLSYQLEDYEAAEASFKRLLQEGNHQDPNQIRMYLGQIAETQKRLPEALDWYAAVTAGEQFLPAQIRQAQVLGRQGRLEDARKHLQQVETSASRDRIQLLLIEAQLLRDAGQAKEAYDLLDASLQTQPNQPDLLYETALLAERIGRMEVVEGNLRKLIQIKPDHAHAYNALGYSLADRGERLDEARQLIAKALEIAPDDPFILDSMGWVLFRRGDLQGALDYLKRAYALRADPEIAAHLGEVLWALGRRDEATKTWREAEKSHPGNEVLANAIKRFIP
jgi:tetratricopeptide (TPR) repeat protein